MAKEVAEEIINIQEWLTSTMLSVSKLISGVVEGIEDSPDRNCLGRSAPLRLQRALDYAQEAKIATPKLREISNSLQI